MDFLVRVWLLFLAGPCVQQICEKQMRDTLSLNKLHFVLRHAVIGKQFHVFLSF